MSPTTSYLIVFQVPSEPSGIEGLNFFLCFSAFCTTSPTPLVTSVTEPQLAQATTSEVARCDSSGEPQPAHLKASARPLANPTCVGSRRPEKANWSKGSFSPT